MGLSMLETMLLVVIVLQGFGTLYFEWKVEQHYRKCFQKREAWRLAQRKSRAVCFQPMPSFFSAFPPRKILFGMRLMSILICERKNHAASGRKYEGHSELGQSPFDGNDSAFGGCVSRLLPPARLQARLLLGRVRDSD
jgi:hypothetical protein